MKPERNPYIDFLRAFGLLLLFVAHTNPPALLHALRTFDVPLMVVVSAICYKPLRGGVLRILHQKIKTDLCAGWCISDNVFCRIGYGSNRYRQARLEPGHHRRQLPSAQRPEHRLCVDHASVPAHGHHHASA